MAVQIEYPFYPIIYVRGYAFNAKEIEDTTANPYMGFNLGSTKIRQRVKRRIIREIFESPLLRLMKDYRYSDTFAGGSEIPLNEQVDPKSIFIYRYYEADSKAFGRNARRTMTEYAEGLNDLIERVKRQVCQGDEDAERAFRVYLVAHSMGGLICRCFLQNDAVGNPATKGLVDKVFTYATPHNGIQSKVGGIPGWLGWNSLNSFNRWTMARYLDLANDRRWRGSLKRVDSLSGKFPPERFFCLVGTNYRDYTVVRRAIPQRSDGLVAIENATVYGAPTSKVHRSHSGHYGIVNSAAGYEHLRSFLFGDARVDGAIQVDDLPLPDGPDWHDERDATVVITYQIEVVVSIRGSVEIADSQKASEDSAILHTRDELLPTDGVAARVPLFGLFLDKTLESGTNKERVFKVDVRLRWPEREIDGVLQKDAHFENAYAYREVITVAVSETIEAGGWRLRYGFDSAGLEKDLLDATPVDLEGVEAFAIPIVSNGAPGLRGRLILQVRSWDGENPAEAEETSIMNPGGGAPSEGPPMGPPLGTPDPEVYERLLDLFKPEKKRVPVVPGG